MLVRHDSHLAIMEIIVPYSCLNGCWVLVKGERMIESKGRSAQQVVQELEGGPWMQEGFFKAQDERRYRFRVWGH